MKAAHYYKLAKYYDFANSDKDSEQEANILRKLISEYKKSKGNQLLDIACGTGKHISYLKNYFKCTGIDKSNEMLNIARKNVPNAKFLNANMLNFNLKKQFDVITCLNSSISLVVSYDNLQKVIKNISNNLSPGGVLLFDPWFQRSEFIDGYVGLRISNGDNLKIVRVNYSKFKNKDLSILDSHFLIAERGKGISHYIVTQQLGLFDSKSIFNILNENNLRLRKIKNFTNIKGLKLYVATKNP